MSDKHLREAGHNRRIWAQMLRWVSPAERRKEIEQVLFDALDACPHGSPDELAVLSALAALGETPK